MTLIPIPDKAVRREILADSEKALNFIQRVIRLSQTEKQNAEAIKTLQAEVATLKDQIRALQTREELLIARMEAAVTRAAAETTNVLARRIGYLEGRASRD